MDQLKRRGRILANRHFLYEEDEETIDHLLVHCKKVRMLWDIFLLIVETSWVFPGSIIQTLLTWQGALVGKKSKNIWLGAPFCLFWTLWTEMNRVAFENGVSSAQRIKVTFLSNLWSWANMSSVDNTYSLLDVLAWLGCR